MLKRKSIFFMVVLLLISMFVGGGSQVFAEVYEGDRDNDRYEGPGVGEKEVMKIKAFELEIELADGTELEWEYVRKRKKVKAEIERGNVEIEGQEAIKQMESILSKLSINKDMNEEEIVAQVLEAVDVNREDIKKLELKIKCMDGNKIKIKQ